MSTVRSDLEGNQRGVTHKQTNLMLFMHTLYHYRISVYFTWHTHPGLVVLGGLLDYMQQYCRVRYPSIISY